METQLNEELFVLYQWRNGSNSYQFRLFFGLDFIDISYAVKVALWFESGGWCDVKEVALERDQGEYLFEYKYVKYKYLPKFLFPIARLDADLIMVECDIEKLASGSVYYKGKDSSPEFMFNSLTAMMATLVDYFESGNTIALDEHYHPDWDWNLLDEIRQRHDPHIREGWEGDTWNSVTNR